MTNKMEPRVKEMWVNALRSGEYSQTTGKLKTPQGFCCLGVLTDLYAKENNKEWEFVDIDDEYKGGYYHFEDNDDFLPVSVRTWAGLDSISPQVMIENDDYFEEFGDDEYIKADLSDLNDDNLSFNEIANLIESQL